MKYPLTEATGRKTVFEYVPFGNRLSDLYYTAPGGVEGIQEQFTYDSVGRIKTRNRNNVLTTYTWDDRGYLIKLVKPGTTIDYVYNALGARVSKTVNGVITKYVSAPLFGMNHVVMELNSSNSVTARHIYGGHEQLIEEVTPGANANDQYLLYGSSVGNITHAYNRSGALVNEYGYDAFGNRTTVSGGNTTRFGYSGEEYDSETGLLYLRARYYDPQIGRFISVDPYLGRLEEPATQNRYVYVRNNPVLYVDPMGYDPLKWVDFEFSVGKQAKITIEPKKGIAGISYEFNQGSYNQPLNPTSLPYVKDGHTFSADIGEWSFNWGEERKKKGLAPAGVSFDEILANTPAHPIDNTNYRSTGIDFEDDDIKTTGAIGVGLVIQGTINWSEIGRDAVSACEAFFK